MRRTSRNLIAALALAGVLSGAAAVPALAAPAGLDSPGPAETAPVETAPAETAPVEATPVEAAPVETESGPLEEAGTEPIEVEAGTVAPSASAASESELVEADAAAEPQPDKNITVGQNRNEATGDVLGRGSEQLIRIEDGKIVILENGRPGAAVLKTIDADLNTKWPTVGFTGTDVKPAFRGGLTLGHTVKHAPSRLAVLGNHIYVSRLLTRKEGAFWVEAGSVVTTYSALTGQKVRNGERVFPDDVAVTALDAYEFDGEPYLAIGLNTYGVRVARVDRPGLPDVRIVHENTWTGRGENERDMTTVVKLGVDDYDRFVLVAGRVTWDGAALVTTDLRAGSTNKYAGTELWGNNWRTKDDTKNRLQWPDLISFGKLGRGATRTHELMAVAWPTLGRVSFLDATNGIDWNWVDGPTGAHGIRFFTSNQGEGLVAIGRDHHTGRYLIGGVNHEKHLTEVDEGPVLGLPTAVAALTR